MAEKRSGSKSGYSGGRTKQVGDTGMGPLTLAANGGVIGFTIEPTAKLTALGDAWLAGNESAVQAHIDGWTAEQSSEMLTEVIVGTDDFELVAPHSGKINLQDVRRALVQFHGMWSQSSGVKPFKMSDAAWLNMAKYVVKQGYFKLTASSKDYFVIYGVNDTRFGNGLMWKP
jgi:hypothetical protein